MPITWKPRLVNTPVPIILAITTEMAVNRLKLFFTGTSGLLFGKQEVRFVKFHIVPDTERDRIFLFLLLIG